MYSRAFRNSWVTKSSWTTFRWRHTWGSSVSMWDLESFQVPSSSSASCTKGFSFDQWVGEWVAGKCTSKEGLGCQYRVANFWRYLLVCYKGSEESCIREVLIRRTCYCPSRVFLLNVTIFFYFVAQSLFLFPTRFTFRWFALLWLFNNHMISKPGPRFL